MPKPETRVSLGLLLRRSHQRAAGQLNEALAPLKLTGRHFGVMLLLRREGESTQRDLIAQTGSDKAGMTRTIADLENLGFITRARSARDKRVENLALSAEGNAAFDSAGRLAGKAAHHLFRGFSDSEVDTLAALLQKFLADEGQPPTSEL